MHLFWTRPEIDRFDALNAAIEQLHHAAQLIAAVGHSLLPHAHDDSHSNMEWLPDHEMLAGDTIDDLLRIGLLVQPFSLCLADLEGHCVEDYPLDGKTMAQALGWLKQQLNLQGLAGDRLQPIDQYELPPHSIGRGGPFQQPDSQVLRQVCICYHNAYGILTGLAKRHTPRASGVRVWPHHFDMAVLIGTRHDEAGERTASIGAGLAIADSICPEPYYYVAPWQQSGSVAFVGAPRLPAGQWHTDGFRGAVLPLGAIPASASAEQQQKVVDSVLEDAIAYCRELLK